MGVPGQEEEALRLRRLQARGGTEPNSQLRQLEQARLRSAFPAVSISEAPAVGGPVVFCSLFQKRAGSPALPVRAGSPPVSAAAPLGRRPPPRRQTGACSQTAEAGQ